MTGIVTSTACFNFAVVGQVRSGTAALASSLAALPGTHCHVGLLDREERVRRHATRVYFGLTPEEAAETINPVWFTPGKTNPYHYLRSQVFDQPRRGEARIGVRLDYAFTARYQLCDTIEEMYRLGDFCVVHVRRNPVACFVSLKQAERSGAWGRMANDADDGTVPAPVRVVPAELTEFVRAHYAEEKRVRAACPDAVLVEHRDLCLDYDRQVRRVAAYVEAPCAAVARPHVRRLRNRPVPMRISNYDDLRKEVPYDVRAALTAPDLY